MPLTRLLESLGKSPGMTDGEISAERQVDLLFGKIQEALTLISSGRVATGSDNLKRVLAEQRAKARRRRKATR